MYLKKLNRNDLFANILNGIPPMFRFSTKNNKVFVLFQNRNLFSDFNFINSGTYHKIFIFIIFYKLLIESFKRTDKIIVQTKSMKKIIHEHCLKIILLFKINIGKIKNRFLS